MQDVVSVVVAEVEARHGGGCCVCVLRRCIRVRRFQWSCGGRCVVR